MYLRASILVSVALASASASAQHATAPNGYYPRYYNGDTFRGKVVAVEHDPAALTLAFENRKKSEQMTMIFDQRCSVPTKNGQPFTESDVPLGTDLTAYYLERKDKSTGQKANILIAISFNNFRGIEIPEKECRVYMCAPGEWVFRAYH